MSDFLSAGLMAGAKVLGSGIAGSLFGGSGQSSGSRRRQARRNQRAVLQQMRIGNRLDINAQKEVFDDRIDRGLQLGLTPVELFGGSAAGPGGGTTGSGATLGNSMSQQQQQAAELAQQDRLQMQTLGAQITADLQKTKMQTDAQKDVAQIQAGEQRHQTDTQAKTAAVVNQIRQGELDLSTRQFEENTLQLLAMQQEKQPHEVKKLINEAATSLPEWQRSQKLLQMGVSNSVNTMLQKRFGIDITDESQMKNLSTEKFRNILSVFMAADSNLYTELAGFFAAQGEDQFGLDPVLGSDFNVQDNGTSSLGNVIRGNSTRAKKGGPAAIRR